LQPYATPFSLLVFQLTEFSRRWLSLSFLIALFVAIAAALRGAAASRCLHGALRDVAHITSRDAVTQARRDGARPRRCSRYRRQTPYAMLIYEDATLLPLRARQKMLILRHARKQIRTSRQKARSSSHTSRDIRAPAMNLFHHAGVHASFAFFVDAAFTTR